MHSVVSPTTYSPGSNIYTRIPTRPSTALEGAYFCNDHQVKLSPTNCAESSLIIPTTSSAGGGGAYVYKSYGNGGGAAAGPAIGTSGGLGTADNNAMASSYVLYGTSTGKRQPSPGRLLGGAGVTNGAGSMTVTTPLISTTNYNGFMGNEFIS